MCSESLPKEFEKTTEVLPFTKYGLSSINEFRKVEGNLNHQEWLKKAGLCAEEIKLYQENEAGLLEHFNKIESSILKEKLQAIYSKINHCSEGESSNHDKPSSSNNPHLLKQLQKKTITFYPEGHPIHHLKEIEEDLFGHLNNGDILPLTKRRKALRRIERNKERILTQENQLIEAKPQAGTVRPGSLWDVKELPPKKKHLVGETQNNKRENIIGPKKLTMYSIKDNKIVRLEPANEQSDDDEYRAVDIVMPVNEAEAELLEGTKMSVDDIKKIDRFKDYEPGIPSKVLYLKNISTTVTQEQLSLLFNQFLLDNGGPVDLRLMSGRMRGQAFVAFQNEDVAIQALEEVNGTILSGQPIIAQFGRNTNRVQIDDDR